MGASNVEVTPGTGKKLQTWENAIGGSDVNAEAVVLVTNAGVEISPATEATIHNNIEHQLGASRSTNPIDYLGITYNADGTVNVITAKTAAAGTTIWTLTCGYTSGNLTSVTRT